MKEKEKIQIPEDVADLVLHACTHFEGNATESVFCHSIHKFIKNSLRELEPALYNNCQKYIPSPQSLYRALGRRPPGYIRKGKGSHYLPQILDCYIRKFEQDFPKEAKRFREEKNSNVPRPIEDSNRIDPAYLTTPAPGQSSCSERSPSSEKKPSLEKNIINFEEYISLKSDDFTGREWLFEQLQSLIHTKRSETYYKSAYLLIHGDPGIGKTAVIAQLAKRHNYVHHFNIQNEGINTASLFLNNICHQLIRKYGLKEDIILPDHPTNSIMLQQVLRMISKQLSPKEEPCIILVDAIDEVEIRLGDTGNILYLPDTLPENIFFILSTREPDLARLPGNSRLEILPITGASKENKEDAAAYLEHIVKKEGIRSYLSRNKKTQKYFIDILLDRSDGNFIYLYHIIREISDGIYASTSLKELPKGLQKYYEQHWLAIKGDDSRKWIDYRLPVLSILAVAELPVDIKFISKQSGIGKPDIIEALTIWKPFLHTNEGNYSLYHKSFRDFLSQKEQVKEEALDLKLIRTEMIDKMKKELL